MKAFIKITIEFIIKLLPKKRWAIILGLILGYVAASLDQIVDLILKIGGVQ